MPASQEVTLDAFVAFLRPSRLSEHTIRVYLGRLRHLAKFAKVDLDDIKFSHIKRYFEKYGKEHSPATQNIAQYAFRAFYWDFRNRKDFDFEVIHKPERRPRRFDVMPKRVYEQFLAAPQPIWFKLILMLMYEHGLDPGEVVTIRSKDVRPDTHQILYKPHRSSKFRQLDLSDEAHDLALYLLGHQKAHHQLFLTQRGTAITAVNVGSTLRRLHQICQVSDRYTAKSMRHAYVIDAYRRRGDLNQILEELGIQSGESLKAYHRLVKEVVSDEPKDLTPSTKTGGIHPPHAKPRPSDLKESSNDIGKGDAISSKSECSSLGARVAAIEAEMQAKLAKVKLLSDLFADDEMASIARELLGTSTS